MNQLKGISVQEKSKDGAIIKEQENNTSKLKQNIASCNEIIAGLRREIIDLEKDANKRIKIAREEEMSKIMSVEFEKKNLEQEISCFNIKISDLEHQYSIDKKELENVQFIINF